jgi:hypothetical protein
LELEHGATFSPETESKLPPEVESQWLDHIWNFEEMSKNAGKITVYERIGKPEYKLSEELSPDELEAELDRILDLMAQNDVILDIICDYEPRVIYRFVTEELFPYEMDDLRMEGMRTHFIYEEFHPNHDYDIRERTKDAVRALLREPEKDAFYNFCFEKTFVTADGRVLDREAASEKFEQFRQAYDSFRLHSLDLLSNEFDETSATVVFSIDYEAFLAGEPVPFKGNGTARLVYEYGGWGVNGLEMPGLVV